MNPSFSEQDLIELISKITREVVAQLVPNSHATGGDSPAVVIEPCICSGTNMTECSSCGLCIVRRSDVEKILDAGVDRIGARPGVEGVTSRLSGMIDHTLLKPDATERDLAKLCDEAARYNFAAVCVNPVNVDFCVRKLKGSNVKVAAVVGFPLGATTTAVKEAETRDVLQRGATEIDMVVDIGRLRTGEYPLVYEDINRVVRAANGHVVKVILETGLLDEIAKVAGCVLAKAAGAHFVKTSTGFGPKGATTEDVALMRKVVGSQMGVKASGGIRDQETAQKMVEAGATRIGASASVAIVDPSGRTDSKGTY